MSKWRKKYIADNKDKIKEQKRQWYIKNREKEIERARKYREDNPERIKKYRQEHKEESEQWRIKHKEETKKYGKQYRIGYRSRRQECNKQYYKDYKDKILNEANQYYLENKGKVLETHKKYQKRMNKVDLKFNFNSRMRRAVGHSLKGNKNGRRWELLVGYDVEELKKHLIKTMPEGYTWQDYLDNQLHIDHKIPISVFNFDRPEHIDFKRCWALRNLQLLSVRENIKKGSRLAKPFQPALKLEV